MTRRKGEYQVTLFNSVYCIATTPLDFHASQVRPWLFWGLWVSEFLCLTRKVSELLRDPGLTLGPRVTLNHRPADLKNSKFKQRTVEIRADATTFSASQLPVLII
jgi:hypothetical protein